MVRLESIVGMVTDAALAERLHHLEHDGKVEYIHLAGEDTARRRLHVATDRGTDCAIVLPRSDRLANGAVLLHGQTGRIRFTTGTEPLLQQGWRRFRQLLQQRYQI